MFCIAHLIALGYGIFTLVRGRFSLSLFKECRGTPAYLIGVSFLSTIPIALFLFLLFNFRDISRGVSPDLLEFGWETVLPDVLGLLIGCGTGIGIAFATVQPVPRSGSRRRRRSYEDPNDIDNPRPRRRRRNDDDDEADERDDRPRYRHRDDDDEDERPRRRRRNDDD